VLIFSVTDSFVMSSDIKTKWLENQRKICSEMSDLLKDLKESTSKSMKENEDLKIKLKEASFIIHKQVKQLEDTVKVINEWETQK
jgi:hypothetical protein